MRMFKTAKAMLAEIGAMETDERNRREDRATVASFFNGKPPLSDEEAEELGFTVNVNNLFGYSELAATKDQLFGLYTKPMQLFTVEIDACPVNLRSKWGSVASEVINDAVKNARRFKPAYEGICGDAAMHGEALLFRPNTTEWCPSQVPLSKLLVPSDASTDITKLTHWAIEGELTLRDIHKYSSGTYPNWKSGALKKILAEIYKDDAAMTGGSIDYENVEEMEYRRQENSDFSTSRRRPVVKVCYFYQVRFDKPNAPVDLTILIHKSESIPGLNIERQEEQDRILFEAECYYDTVRECISPFFLDCTLGGEPKWHRVLGTGHLNYTLNHAVELLVNRAMQGTIEGMMNLWQAKDSATREEIQQVLLKHNGVVPENVSLIQQRFTPDFAGALGMIQFFRQQGSRNARQTQPNTGDRNDMLEVQAMALQGQMGEQTSTRTSNWYDYLDFEGQTIWQRMVNPFIRPSDAGYSEIKGFQAKLARAGIPLYWVQAHNVKVRAVRILGDGNTNRERIGALWLAQNRAMFPPQSQQRITRIAAAAMTGSHAIAEELMPINETPDSSQVGRAEAESNTCIVQGRPPAVADDDVDDLHVPIHLTAMTGIIERASQFQNATFTPEDFLAFRALGGHVVMHIQKVESMVGQGRGDANKDKARLWMQGLNEVASLGEKFAHNMQQKMEGQNEKPDPVEVAKLQLAAQQLALSRDKFDFSQEKWQRQQNHKENQTAFSGMIAIERNRRENEMAKNKMASNDVTTALQLMQPATSGSTE